jgi:hypothetical protein
MYELILPYHPHPREKLLRRGEMNIGLEMWLFITEMNNLLLQAPHSELPRGHKCYPNTRPWFSGHT